MEFQQHILGSSWCKFTLIMLSQHILDHHGVVTILANMTQKNSERKMHTMWCKQISFNYPVIKGSRN